MAARNSTTLARPERLLALKRAFAARKEPGFARKKHGQNGGSGALPEKGYIKIYTFLYITAIALPHQTGQGFLRGAIFDINLRLNASTKPHDPAIAPASPAGPTRSLVEKTDWERLRAMSDEEVTAA